MNISSEQSHTLFDPLEVKANPTAINHPVKSLGLASLLVSSLIFSASVSAQVGDLIWEDNFNTLNQDVWTIDSGNGCDQGLCGWGNAELQSYQTGNVTIQTVPGESGNSALAIEARQETIGAEQFTSGKILSDKKLSVKYGMIEYRMQVPNLDQGYWPAVWMLGTSTLPWPRKGEIDMMEMGHREAARREWFEFNENPNDDAGATDTSIPAPALNNFTGSNLINYAEAACVPGNETCAASAAYQSDNAYVSNTSFANRFVTYRMYWTPEMIRFTVEDNGAEHDMFSEPQILDETRDAFREPFFLLMNMAVGGNFTDAANPNQVTAPAPGTMLVDYIRVYQYDGHGEVFQGDLTTPETGTFGVFTDNTPTTNKLIAGESSRIFLWDPSSIEGDITPNEGDNVIAFNFEGSNTWFGGGVQSNQARDMSNFEDGVMKFDIQIPADVPFRIGITDTFTNENWLTFPAFENKYGLVRNGLWGQVTIPLADLRGDLVALQSLQYMFAISSDPASFPAGPFQYAIDDIVYEGGGNPPTDSDGDGVIDNIDTCPSTPTGVAVDQNGCPLVVVIPTQDTRIQAEDYNNYNDSSAGNQGGAHRSDDVDIEVTTDLGGGFNVGWINSGEWLEYSVELGAGVYELSARVASNANTGAYTVSLDNSPIGSSTVPSTGGWQNFETQPLGQFTVASAGNVTIRMDATGDSFNLNWIDFTVVAQAIDSDGDGVLDSADQCPDTASGKVVDANGCEIVHNNDVIGITKIDQQTVELFVNGATWADVHYRVNGGNQLNVRMVFANNHNTYSVSGLADDDQISYWFTYLNPTTNLVVDSDTQVYLHSGDNTDSPTPMNISDGASVIASSEQQDANLAIDGNSSTRWESDLGVDPSWIRLDLGSSYSLSEIIIDWEAANPERYQIQGSNNDTEWVTLKAIENGQFGDRRDRHDITGHYRYIRILGLTRSAGNNWGYSIWELQVFGSEIVSNGDADNDGVQDSSDNCPNTPANTTVDNAGCPINNGGTGNVTPLFNASTQRQTDSQWDRGDALITRFSDRPRTRHAREDQFQSYDHYVKFYFENRASNIEIVDYVAKGGSTIEMNVRTLWPLNQREAENRWWYIGQNTVAHYAGNGIMEYKGFDGQYYNYQKIDNLNRQDNREIRMGDRLEFEISQFSDSSIPRGQANYYGTTFLYIVGQGIVPWYATNTGPYPEDSREIPLSYRLGGKTTLPYQYSDEPNDHFMQMATNLGYDNAQKFLVGRRVHHSSFIDGSHDEDPENGIFDATNGVSSAKRYINDRCSGCHERNGGAAVAANNESLDKWVFKVGDANGNADPQRGRVLQPKSQSGEGEGSPSISFWSDVAGNLRKPNYQFSNGTPARFSARIAPRLVGLGLLEAIPEDTILAMQDPNDANGDGISGRANLVNDPQDSSIKRLGRFGWKATTSSVRHQAAAALNTDMGVKTSVLPNLDCGSAQSNCNAGGRTFSDARLNELVTYLTTLGVRPQRGWKTGTENQSIIEGKARFNQIGCDGCHTPSIQTSAFHPFAEVRDQTIHPYSDLLLHDMGDGLADNLGEGLASGREWRTTPLWGLGHSSCVTGGVINPSGQEGGEICSPKETYLHDGRARSIDEAIRWHGGEADNAKNQYQNISDQQRQELLMFLQSL